MVGNDGLGCWRFAKKHRLLNRNPGKIGRYFFFAMHFLSDPAWLSPSALPLFRRRIASAGDGSPSADSSTWSLFCHRECLFKLDSKRFSDSPMVISSEFPKENRGENIPIHPKTALS
jgi:hypothetical protein